MEQELGVRPRYERGIRTPGKGPEADCRPTGCLHCRESRGRCCRAQGGWILPRGSRFQSSLEESERKAAAIRDPETAVALTKDSFDQNNHDGDHQGASKPGRGSNLL